MNKIKELRMTLIILLVGMFFLSGCFFSNKYEVSFKTNGGSEVENVQVKSGNTLEEPATPKKEGFVFEGWYLDGEEYDFDSEVKKDMTLVAKWRKVDIGDNDNDNDQNPIPDDNSSTTSSTTKSTNKVTYTTTLISVKTKTTKKTTKKVTELASTKKTTEKVPEKPSEKPTDPTKPTNPTTPIDPVVPEKEELKINIKEIELIPESTQENNLEDKNEENKDTEEVTTPEVIPNKYKYEINFASEEVNVVSNITEDELQDLLKSDKSKWIIYNDNGFKYSNNYSKVLNAMTLEGDYKTNSVTIGIPVGTETKYYTLDKVITTKTVELEDKTQMEEEIKWYINYPNVSLTTKKVVDTESNELPSIDPIMEVYYYSNLDSAIKLAKDNDTISILRDITVTNTIEINKLLTIVGNSHKVTYVENIVENPNNTESSDVSIINYLFVIKDINSPDGVIKFENIEFDVKSFMHIEHTALFKTLELYGVKTKYVNQYIINNSTVSISQDTETSFTYGALL